MLISLLRSFPSSASTMGMYAIACTYVIWLHDIHTDLYFFDNATANDSLESVVILFAISTASLGCRRLSSDRLTNCVLFIHRNAA